MVAEFKQPAKPRFVPTTTCHPNRSLNFPTYSKPRFKASPGHPLGTKFLPISSVQYSNLRETATATTTLICPHDANPMLPTSHGFQYWFTNLWQTMVCRFRHNVKQSQPRFGTLSQLGSFPATLDPTTLFTALLILCSSGLGTAAGDSALLPVEL
ncbi:UNVERIFIED_CONTAM: hypothetical protein K2H54_051385 [Gekko kuhli]